MPDTSTLSRFLKPEHVKDDDIITFLDAGTITEKEFKREGKVEKNNVLELNIEVKGNKRIYSPNSQSLKFLNAAWGTQTEKWVGRQARITLGLAPNGKETIIAKPVLTDADKAQPTTA